MADGVMGSALHPVSTTLASGMPGGEMAVALQKLGAVLTGTRDDQGSVITQLRAIVASMNGSPDVSSGFAVTLAKAALAAEGIREYIAVMSAAVDAVKFNISASSPMAGVVAPQLVAMSFSGGPRFSVFPAATVLSLSGLNYNLYDDMPAKFKGMFATAPYTMVKVSYPASLKSTSIATGVANLDAAIRATTGPIIVLAQSQGAQVASAWIELYKDDPTAPDSSRLMFIFTGNPLRSNGSGYLIGRIVVGGGLGVPTPTDGPWIIIDVARRYEGWADWPSDETNKVAVHNAETGKSLRHKKYDQVNLFDKNHTVWTVGNTTYVLTAEDLPDLEKQWWMSPLAVTQIRAKVEEAYVGLRPVSDPPTTVTPTDNWFWKWVLSTMDIET